MSEQPTTWEYDEENDVLRSVPPGRGRAPSAGRVCAVAQRIRFLSGR